MEEFLVIYNGTKKVIKCENRLAKTICTSVRKRFLIPEETSLTVQHFFKKFNDIADLSDEDEVQSEITTVKIVEKIKANSLKGNVSDDKLVSSPTSSLKSSDPSGTVSDQSVPAVIDVAQPSHDFVEFETNSNGSHKFSVKQEPTTESTSEASTSEATTSKATITVKNRRVFSGWPSKFMLPSFSENVLSALEEKQPVTAILRREIVKTLFEKMLTHEICPKPAHYLEVAIALVSKYPHLSDVAPGNQGIQDGNQVQGPSTETVQWNPYSSWRVALSVKYRNDKRRIKALRDAAIEAKTKRQSEESSSPNISVKRKYVPVPIGEDVDSIKRHELQLLDEFKKNKQNQDKINNLLRLTYSERTKIVKDKDAYEALQLRYPALFTTQGLLNELKIMFDVDADMLMVNFFRSEATTIRKLLDSSKSTKCRKVVQTHSESSCSDNYKNSLMAVLGLVALCGDSPDEFIFDYNVESLPGAPQIVSAGSKQIFVEEQNFFVYVNASPVVECLDIISACECAIALCYILELKYSEKTRKSYSFLQHYVLGIPPIVSNKNLAKLVKNFVSHKKQA